MGLSPSSAVIAWPLEMVRGVKPLDVARLLTNNTVTISGGVLKAASADFARTARLRGS